MKIYEEGTAPNARRVRMFLAEKGVSGLEYVHVGLKNGDNISHDFRKKNPLGKIPVLELDSGEYISESMAICRYFEALHPENPLMGLSPLEQATIEMWQRRCEISFMNIVGMGFQHSTGYFADRMNPIKEWGEECLKLSTSFMVFLNEHLKDHKYIAGEAFSVADITAFIAIDFARVVKIRIEDDQTDLLRWYKEIKSRPSAKS
jgi:glutathione S-transferase